MSQQTIGTTGTCPLPVPQPTTNTTTPLPPTPTKQRNASSSMQGAFDFRKLSPIAAFFMGFATVMTLLLIYMDNKALRHHQFNINMTKDYDLIGVRQDDPQLIVLINQVFLTPAVEPHHKTIEYTAEEPMRDVEFVLKLLNNKTDGNFVEAGAYGDGKISETEWLEKRMNWKGLLIQPDPKHYFSLKRHNRPKSKGLHGCLSSAPYPKEVTYHQEERNNNDDVKINSIHSNFIDDSDLFSTRVKCFPLYSLLLAMNMTNVDYFSLESRGTELQVLETIPFERVQINVIDVHLLTNDTDNEINISKFLLMKNYTLVQNFDNTSYIYKSNYLDKI